MGLFDVARRRGLTEGVLGGVAWGLRAISWAVRREERVVFRDALRPGETLVISERQLAPKRRGRKG